MCAVVIDQKLVWFAGAMNGHKTLRFYHGDHLKYPPPTIGKWCDIAGKWLNNIPIGQWLIDGEKISNHRDQWVFVDVRELIK